MGKKKETFLGRYARRIIITAPVLRPAPRRVSHFQKLFCGFAGALICHERRVCQAQQERLEEVGGHRNFAMQLVYGGIKIARE